MTADKITYERFELFLSLFFADDFDPSSLTYDSTTDIWTYNGFYRDAGNYKDDVTITLSNGGVDWKFTSEATEAREDLEFQYITFFGRG